MAWLQSGGASQNNARLTIDAALYNASIWKHTPKITIETGVRHWSGELGVSFQTLGRRDWQAWHRYPVLGLSLLQVDLGQKSHGSATAFLPHLRVPLFRRPNWVLYFRMGTGVGYIRSPYDYFNNPGQNAIGSHWNNITQLRFSAEARLSGHLNAEAGAGLTHFFNGGMVLPNYGINLPGFFAGLRYSVQAIKPGDFRAAQGSKRPEKRWGVQVHGGLARVEYGAFDGPRYPIWMLSAAAYHQFNPNNRLLLGLDYEFNRAIYAWGLRSTGYRTELEAHKAATRLGLALADEILFGALGIQLHTGVYIGPSTINRDLLSIWYNKLGMFYYLPRIPQTMAQPRVGIYLKAHKAIAEYIALDVGCSF
ncbi:MAG: acyloxyacyl hydrolase [Lewinellaceae bacterium]|nr:acyloxyacyl hydrolase [Lewinellaceae bacterium]